MKRTDSMTQKIELIINKDLCKGCGLCCLFCPKNILSLGDAINSHGYSYVEVSDQQKCIGCGRCYQICPDLVFEIRATE